MTIAIAVRLGIGVIKTYVISAVLRGQAVNFGAGHVKLDVLAAVVNDLEAQAVQGETGKVFFV